MTPFTFNAARSIVFGEGRAREIGRLAKGLLGPRVLIVTDPGIVSAHLVDPVHASLVETGIEADIFAEVVADPPESVVLEAVARAEAFGVTGIVGLGGGSSLDVAKLVALMLGGGEALAEIYGVDKAIGPRLPLVLVPTTAGTGSEVTPVAVVTTPATEKKGVSSSLLLPDLALLDPQLTYKLPHAVTAATGIDAMVHAIEAYSCINPNNNFISRLFAREALRLLGDSIRSVVREGSHPEARANMLKGSMLAGAAFANSPVGAVHALAYPLGSHFKLPHGVTNALVLPHVMRFNLPAAEAAYAEIGPCAFPFVGDMPALRRASAFIDALAHLTGELGVPTRLSEVGVGEGDLDLLAQDAMKQTRLLVNNPRPVTLADARAIYAAAL